MGEQKRNDVFIDICTLIFGSLMVFYQLLPSVVIAGCSILFFSLIYYKFSKKYRIIETLAISSIVAIPTSTISIVGGSYSALPLTWYNFFILLATCIIAIEGKLSRAYFVDVTLFAVFGLFGCISVPSFFNGFKQYLIIVLFLFSFFVGEYLKNFCEYNIQPVLIKYYTISCFCVAIQVFIQRAFIQSTGIIIGHHATMGKSRIAYAGIMGDYSFATLFLASGCLILLLEFACLRKTNLVKFVTREMILLYAMLLISARTGIVTFCITLILFFVFNFRKVSGRLILVSITCVCLLPVFVTKLMSSRGGQALFETSGRAENYMSALQYWLQKPILGFGLGLENLHDATNLGVPHNFFVQYLVQIGVVGLVLIMVPLIRFLKRDVLQVGYVKWLFILIAIGSMFIPDIVSSRYLYGVVLICMTGQLAYCEKGD